MQSLADASALRIGPAPLHVFALREGASKIFARAADVDPELWEQTFSGQPKDFSYYELLERTMSRGYLYRYLVLFSPNDEPFALQPLVIVDQDLTIAFAPHWRRAIAALRRFFPRFLCARILLAGCLVGDGRFGVRKDFHRRKATSLLAEALFACTRAEDISLVTIKDFSALERSEMQPLRDAGFTRIDGFPPLHLELNFASFDDHLRKHASKITRKGLRRKFRTAAAAKPPITLEVLADCRAVIDEIYPLYLAVARRSEIQFEIFSRKYFLDASVAMPERSRFFVWRQGGKVIAFSFCMICGDTIFDNDIGLDYAVAHQLHLYDLSFRDIVDWALDHGCRHYRTSPFNYESKLRLRLQLEPVDLFVRHSSVLVNFALKKLAPFFAPARSDPALRRHFSGTS
ncbi:MAG TPA: GNAT family N-acetyltransferase [Chthoniobacterales bacterium]|jgi:predicted N-acyltransferase